MIAQVDVLAVMDMACKLHKQGAHADAWEVDLAEIHEARAAVAALIVERDALAQEVERLQGDGVHSCGPFCQRIACVLQRERDALREEVAALRHQPAPVVDDAMRELIEADKEYDAIRQRAQRYPCQGMDEHVTAVRKRRAAALARAQGVQS